ncbi:class III poly(R)-hydroxyalkanoic acid synthase subunit PhaE [Pseudolysobacter antarcticus]|uniref:Poly(3-hydroxyalkanoate) polymerase subunit PhaE n=1 Tax=Pseudolysobacter antarcticus TaxID=2511995 RepID=A0A411HLN6_9GAMM|nr:class III poly(R)-hydroxyalkanoic acid synthase subunit PhaE [Pseudolysobacter antarcticus]QBB71324.1 class III poly(R)-hydroxyalkanoic acid synthase subunit PhaE [Pseudolysobacter antarcticus]
MTDEMDWAKMQAKYWNAFNDLTHNAATDQARGGAAAAPWQEGIEQWSRLFGNQPNHQSDVVERMLASAKTYLATMQSTLGGAFANPASGFDGSANTGAWMDSLRNAFAMPGGFSVPGFDASLSNNPMSRGLRDIAGQGAKSFEQLGAQMAPFIEAAKRESSAMLKLPAFGSSREKTERLQKLLAAWTEYEEANKNYNAELAKSSQRSFEILEDKLAERSEPGRQIDSMRGFYDLWVDSAEEAYAEIAMAEDFRKVYGNYINAQMRVRGLVQQEIEHNTRELGMPTRTEINSVEKRLHELRRELRRSAEAGESAMAQELANLRAEVDALRTAAADKPARAADKPANVPVQKKSAPVPSKIKPVAKAPVAKVAAPKTPAAKVPATKLAAAAAKAPSKSVASKRSANTFAASLNKTRAVIAKTEATKAKRASSTSAKRR